MNSSFPYILSSCQFADALCGLRPILASALDIRSQHTFYYVGSRNDHLATLWDAHVPHISFSDAASPLIFHSSPLILKAAGLCAAHKPAVRYWAARAGCTCGSKTLSVLSCHRIAERMADYSMSRCASEKKIPKVAKAFKPSIIGSVAESELFC